VDVAEDGTDKGITSLNDALITAKQAEQHRLAHDAKVERLENDAPELMEQMRKETLELDAAIAVLSAREQDVRDIRDAGQRSADKIVKHFVGCVQSIHRALAQGEKIIVKRELMKQYIITTTTRILVEVRNRSQSIPSASHFICPNRNKDGCSLQQPNLGGS
jgi:hypothetical protein